MDDLSGLDWSSSNAPPSNKPPPTNTPSSFYTSLRPTPSPLGSGRNTPLSAQGSGSVGSKPPSQKPAGQKPAQDSFSSLLSFGAAKNVANLSLKEQQERLQAEKLRKEEERRKQAQAHYGDGQYWDTLGSNRSTPLQASRTASPAIAPPASSIPLRNTPTLNKTNTDDDLFAAFNADTKVDNSSYYPPSESSKTSTPANAPPLNLSSPSAWDLPSVKDNGGFGDDDDPFGLNQLKPTTRTPGPADLTNDDDDFLGDLAKPVEEVRRKKPTLNSSREPEPGKPIEDSSSDSDEETPPSNDPFDKAVAELVGYGFSPENARRGLTESGGGLNVQAAANWLLDDAHKQAKAKQLGAKKAPTRQDMERTSSQSRNGGAARMREQDNPAVPGRGDNRSPSSDVDFTKTAAAVGTTIFKTANSLWKTGQKKMQKAVAELQQDGGDPSQPKWMRDAQLDRATGERKAQADATDEAMMLESGARPGRRPARPQAEGRPASGASSRDQSPVITGAPPSRNNAVPKWQQSARASPLDPRARLGRQAIEEESAQMYVSPARRKKTPQPPAETSRPVEAEPDLLFNSSAIPKKPATLPQRSAQPSPAPPPQSRPQRPSQPASKPRPTRQIPPISPAALQTSTRHRVEGTAHFKRGDYAAAHTSYSSSLSAVPQTHPLAILLLCNRALTALKTGEPRQAVSDADTALGLIGPGKGEGESVDLDGSERRDMRELYGKALTRKAEALEQMEKWADAGAVWQTCVEAGVGGPTAIAGRQRCQKALAPKPAVRPRPAAPAARPRPAAAPASQKKDSEAVERLRAANKAAAREDGEKLALVDKVDARIAAWRDGKRENLRALLGSLDGVLWEGSGWKKVGLHELVMANKVKVVYMKAIAKTHPDKLPQDASTEVRMIAGTVFSTLNEAWDKFKAENGL
ncbi:hypothetical protein CONLIGDRAFT_632100 [Coniochaeta ligniaria NRRL 30616]|uniref:UBA domain-containing protein n=1 Tax=Coniochaeta ligniaria NRRL 30616 TaxID=1408157 RepID=A0A1J7IS21_9PEZI|nr:hypothetical protein CONLIGDRAFT_632100 [Coniochaeta ligniaria NRRL 30616]